jgi:hypothetical protein
MVWPDLIINKIYWYLWKLQITQINIEYYKTWLYKSDLRVFMLVHIKSGLITNYRYFLEPTATEYYMNDPIFKLSQNFRVSVIPHKYYYSSGLHSLDGYKYAPLDYARILKLNIPSGKHYSNYFTLSDIPKLPKL